MNETFRTQYQGNVGGLKDVIRLRDKISPETFALEQEKIFKKSWLMIGHVGDVPREGS